MTIKKFCLLFAAAMLAALKLFAQTVNQNFYLPVMGQRVHIFDQSAGENRPWYINDHCFIKGPDNRYHLFGITHKKEIVPPPWAEHSFAHASQAEILDAPWEKHPRVLNVDKGLGETHLWAPHIIQKDGTYYMFYAGGGGHWDSMLNLATSKDLFHWDRAPVNPLFRDFYDARDPMVLKYGDDYLLYYCKTCSKTDHRSTVALRRSKDLLHWSEPESALALSDYPRLVNSGHTESPFVFAYRGMFYLSVCSPYYHYRLTRVFVSDTPFHFDEKNEITAFIAHCAEVPELDGKLYASHAGWFYDGVYLSPLTFQKAKKFEPQFVFVNSGENEDFLAGKKRAMAIKPGVSALLGGKKVLRIEKGGSVQYRVPVPSGCSSLQLLVAGKGGYLVSVNGQSLAGKQDPISAEGLDRYYIDNFQSGPDQKIEFALNADKTYELNFLRIYFVR